MINLDYVDPVTLTGFVRNLPTDPNLSLNLFLPDRYVADVEAMWDEFERHNRAATFRAWDAGVLPGKRDNMRRQRIAFPPLGQKLVMGEWERLQLQRARSGGDPRNQIVEQIYDDAKTNRDAVLNRMEMARGSVLQSGRFTLAGENNLFTEADFGVQGDQFVDASILWSDLDDSDPIEEMLAWKEFYRKRAGEPPAWMLTSDRVIGNLMRNQKIRVLGASIAGTPNIVTRTVLDQVLQAYGLPTMVTYETQIEDYEGTVVSPWPDHKLAFLPRDPRSLGETLWGLTVEGLELVNGQNPGLTLNEAPGLVGYVTKDIDPVQVWTGVGATGMPMIRNRRKLFVADVLTPAP